MDNGFSPKLDKNDPEAKTAVQAYEEWSNKYIPLAYIELLLTSVPKNIPAANIWTVRSGEYDEYLSNGFQEYSDSSNSPVKGYVITKEPVEDITQFIIITTEIRRPCDRCEDGCDFCDSVGTQYFEVVESYPLFIATEQELNWFIEASQSGNSSAMNELGLLLENRGDFTAAQKWYLQSAQLGYPMAMNNLAMLCEDQGKLDDAEAWYLKAVELEFPAAVNNYALFQSNRGNYEEAESLFLRAIELGHENAKINLAITLMKSGNEQGAEFWYRKAVDSGNLVAMNNLALLLKDRGLIEEAEQLLLKAIDLNSYKAMNNLAQICLDRGETAEAKNWFLRSIDVENNKFAVDALALIEMKFEQSQSPSSNSGEEPKPRIYGNEDSAQALDEINPHNSAVKNPLANIPLFDEAVRRLNAWATKYRPLCFIELAAVDQQLPTNLAGHLWTQYSWDLFNLIETGYKQDLDTVMGYVITETPAPAEQNTLLQTWIQGFCVECGGLGVDDEESSCVTCAGFGEFEFTVPIEYPLVLTKWEDIEAFSDNFHPHPQSEQALNFSKQNPKEFDDMFFEDDDFNNIANIILNFQFEADGQDRDNLKWRSDGLNPVDTFLQKYDELFVVIEKFIEEEIDHSELESGFAEQVSRCWSELCSLYRYQGDQTFDGDLDEFTDFFNVLHYSDMGLSVESELFTIFGGKDPLD